MFSNHERLKRKTPANGIGRKEFIQHLVDEYYTTTDIEAQEQVTANLANFAYDPINWEFLKQAETLQLFIELLDVPNERLHLHAIVGLCNICLDTVAFEFITKPENYLRISKVFLSTENIELTLQVLTLQYQLLSALTENLLALKSIIISPNILKKVTTLRHSVEDQRILNLIKIILEDFATRNEIVEIPSKPADSRHNKAEGESSTLPKYNK